jgi:hypothetical protein
MVVRHVPQAVQQQVGYGELDCEVAGDCRGSFLETVDPAFDVEQGEDDSIELGMELMFELIPGNEPHPHQRFAEFTTLDFHHVAGQQKLPLGDGAVLHHGFSKSFIEDVAGCEDDTPSLHVDRLGRPTESDLEVSTSLLASDAIENSGKRDC